ncbi:NAD(P)/FAD-dependent oxidoreductase [Burkholderia cepacia]|uniref:NAD(P)/FAD-dependent oxidoreductase n=1 Tax=Burkholderia cepacia TaxID=292 RepID=UPI0039A5F40E
MRTQGFEGRIVLVGDEECLPYERPPLSKDVMLATEDANCFSAWLHPEAFYGDARIEWLCDYVERLDCAARIAVLRHHGAIHFDRCLLATGGRARELPVAGGARNVCSLRTLADAKRLRERMVNARAVAVIGGGFLGLEFAASAWARGLEVTVYESAPRLLGRAVPEQFADRLRLKHESHGVQFVFSPGPLEIGQSPAGVSVKGSQGTRAYDFCVAAIGQLPNEELARTSGIEVKNGILVDAWCRTSAPGIYAAGDCANFPFGPERRATRLESWQNAQEQAVVAARNMLGEMVEYRPLPWFWTDQYDWNIQIQGVLDGSIEQWIERRSADEKALLMGLRGGAIVYALAVNQGGVLRAIRGLIERATVVDAAALVDPSVRLRELARKAG